MAEYREDAGYAGQIRSLADVPGTPGRGLVTTGTYLDLSTGHVLSGVNARRKWAIIQNVSTGGETIKIQIGVLGSFYIFLSPLGYLQIDENFPWTGAIGAECDTPGVTALVRMVEASVE